MAQISDDSPAGADSPAPAGDVGAGPVAPQPVSHSLADSQIQVTVVLPAPTSSVTPLPGAPTPTIHAFGPWIAGRLFSVVPPVALMAIEDSEATWYAITKGRAVGVTDLNTLDLYATSRVSGAGHKGYLTQAAALSTFNGALRAGVVQVVVDA
ncbi:hypothetical protein FB451DRAFT_1170842 [Mycena latifolia]|nr:hypothetical protein FB451DRAFT_1170842 [Mycena latifolia]